VIIPPQRGQSGRVVGATNDSSFSPESHSSPVVGLALNVSYFTPKGA